MKKLILCMAIILGSFIAKGQSSINTRMYIIESCTPGRLANGQIYKGETYYADDYEVISITGDVMYTHKGLNAEITNEFRITNKERKANGVTYTTKQLPYYNTVIVMYSEHTNGKVTFSFIKPDKNEAFIYVTEPIK